MKFSSLGIRSKVYSYILEENGGKKALKGVKLSNTKSKIHHQHFVDAINNSQNPNWKVKQAEYNEIRSKNHEIRTVRTKKATLIPFNDKKFFSSKSIYSHGHKNIKLEKDSFNVD